jgi:hypothetical protein
MLDYLYSTELSWYFKELTAYRPNLLFHQAENEGELVHAGRSSHPRSLVLLIVKKKAASGKNTSDSP